MNYDEIMARLAAIREEINTPDADLEALNTEAEELAQQRDALAAQAMQRANILGNIARGAGTVIPSAPTPAPVVDVHDTPEYRTNWLHLMQGTATAEQRAAVTTTDTGAVMPTQTANRIIDEIKTIAPLLGEITLLHVNGGVRFAVESGRTGAAVHAENATITPSSVSLTSVSLSAFEICKLIQISESVRTMTIDSFESWLVRTLAKALAETINGQITRGGGSTEATGVETAYTWGETNSVTVSASGSLTASDVFGVVGLLPAAYDAKAKWVMSKRTLITCFLPLMDKAKNSLVTQQGNQYFVLGYPVLLDDTYAYSEAILGDWTTVYGNMPLNATVRSAYDINTNSYKYGGVAMFDCKPTKTNAFVKVVKATS